MPFPEDQRTALLALRGIGPTVITRLEQMGFDSLSALAKAEPADVLTGGSALTGSSCWKNSPQAKSAIDVAIRFARSVTTRD